MRRVWLKLHLWLGLILGVWLSLIGLTGSLLVFYHELEEQIHPEIFAVTPQPEGEAAFKPFDEIYAAIQADMPENVQLGSIFYPRTKASSWWGRYTVATGPRAGLWYVFVDPYTAQILDHWYVKKEDQWFRREFSGFIYDLHYKLLLPAEIGTPLVGIIAILTLVSISIGIYLWWPKKGKWRQSLSIKRGASPQRFVFDLHNVSGIYLLPALAVVVLSGVYFNLPEQFYWMVKQFSPGTVEYYKYNTQSAPPALDVQPIGLARAFDIARLRFPEGRPEFLRNAATPDSTYRICSKQVVNVSAFADVRCVHVDQYNGEILHFSASGNHTAGDSFARWQLPLHSGKAFGLPGRILILLSGLALPVLFITGAIRWLQKRRSEHKERGRQPYYLKVK
ncbi:MAG: PepSY domain-containing protein [Nitrosomonas sp.]|nr:PepSY domain-containing protein [Nitrosomonas sp.]